MVLAVCLLNSESTLLGMLQGNVFGICTDAVICQQGSTNNVTCGNNFAQCQNQFQDQDGANKFYPM